MRVEICFDYNVISMKQVGTKNSFSLKMYE